MSITTFAQRAHADRFAFGLARVSRSSAKRKNCRLVERYISRSSKFEVRKCLRLSDLRAANDPREIDLGYEKVIHALKSVVVAQAGPKRELLSHLIERLIGYFERTQVFCSCFSLAVDELPMWAAYGQNYSGLAIGFRPAAIVAIPAGVQKVKYLDPSKDEGFKELALDIAAQVDIYQKSGAIEPWISAGVDAITAITALKHQIWAYEKEVRLIYVQAKKKPPRHLAKFPVSSLRKEELIYWREPVERKAGARSVNYVEFPFGRYRDGKVDPARAIKTIILGPNCPLPSTP